jgi:hypothetical protein
MTNENEDKFKVLSFPKPSDEETPKFVVEVLEKMLAKAKEGKLDTLIAHFSCKPSDTEEEYNAGTVFWNDSGNPVEMVGLTEILKSMALSYVFDHDHDHEE